MARPDRRIAAALLALLLLLLGPWASAAPRIGVATMQPGEIFWERFGHDALVVVDPATGAATSYNFGFFDPSEPGFVGNFVHGIMRYRLAALPFDEDMVMYRDEGRGVSIQWLQLSDAQAVSLASALAINARPENAVYRYDYFRDNCSTRVRDAIDSAVGGELRRQLVGRSHGSTYRSEAVRLASPATWMWLGFDVGLGPSADRPLSLWEESFVPMRLAAALREVRIDGHPLVAAEVPVLPHRIAPEPTEAPRAVGSWLAVGVVLGLGLAFAGAGRPRCAAAFALVFWTVSSLLGMLLLFLWLDTVHRFAWANRNLLLLDPLALLALPGAWRLVRGRAPGPLMRRLLPVLTAVALVAVFVSWLESGAQDNARWIALLLPIHAGIWAGLRDTSRPSADSIGP
ncbi:DUF4105 domain-containing protein [Cognatilysobacter lacus]|uniref:DUF4105 domain-containing protein n=1 Tax=Cognatilysobacter lacus TaxID=1643323 RepID=A0A5D8ZGL4_9GAMM|nr:DUF4105 domain-containing protein [Lysobacter lacus]TZF91804.1 DUF4105 domain-containing protein [Lysobacter lacus]